MLLSPFNVTIQVIQKVFCTPASSNLHSKKTFSVTWLKYPYIAERSARTNFILSLYRKIKNIFPLTQKKYLRAVRSKKKEQCTHRINSNLPGESIARERKSIAFYKQGEITPLLQKAIPEIEKRKEKHNTQKIFFKFRKKKNLKLFLSCNAKEKTNA